MTSSLTAIFETIIRPGETGGRLEYAVKQVPEKYTYFVGRDLDGSACILIEVLDPKEPTVPPIRLEKLSAEFFLTCRIVLGSSLPRNGNFSIIKCISDDPEIIRYFFDVCGLLIEKLGEAPSMLEVANGVQKIASIFELLKRPATRTVNGLFGELFFISRSKKIKNSVEAWRPQENTTFDFSFGPCRLEIKTSSNRIRKHSFSFEQCSPPNGVTAFVCSILTERASTGVSIRDLLQSIDKELSGHPELKLKLHEVVSETLGKDLFAALDICFDEQLTNGSLKFFDLKHIPAIRERPSGAVSEIRFNSDLTNIRELSSDELALFTPQLNN